MRASRTLPLLGGAGLWALVAASPLVLAQGPSAAPTREEALAAIRIGNFGQVNEQFYRGKQPKGDDYRALAALGVKTVIDLQEKFQADEQHLVEKAGMQFRRIPLNGYRKPTAAEVEQFLTIVNDPAMQPVYLHCAEGKHRTGALAAVYRMTNDGWSADKAYREMKDYKFKVPLNFLFGHHELKKFVYEYYGVMQANAAAAAAAAQTSGTK